MGLWRSYSGVLEATAVAAAPAMQLTYCSSSCACPAEVGTFLPGFSSRSTSGSDPGGCWPPLKASCVCEGS